MKHYTSIEQSIHLEKLGLDIMTADMFYNEEPDENYPKDIIDTKYPMVIREGQKHHLEEYGTPCWSLSALLEVMPDTIEDKDGVTFGLNIEKRYAEYFNPSMGALYSIHHSVISDTTLDAAFEMVVWLIENGYIKTNK